MRKKISFIIIVLLISFSLQSKNKASNSELDKSVSAPISLKRADVIRFAKNLLGTPYRFACSNPKKGFDCSGFVNYVYKKFKIKLPRSSAAFGALGKGLKPEEFKEGDVLVFYGFKNKTRIGHVGIICEAAGMNSKFIHSSSGKAKGVIISELSSDMYKRRFYKCVDEIN
ncbi:MAG: C40 family peptidase [Bacteroidia bacterium]|nr:C40 family peptidase [Bacteroidia bacterium]